MGGHHITWPTTQRASLGRYLIVLGASFLSILAHVGYALAFSTQPIVAGYLKTRRYIQSILSVFYIAAAYKLFTSNN